MSKFKLLIGGKLVPGAAALDVVNPATEEILAACPRADRTQFEAAVAAAKAAFRAWSSLPLKERAKTLLRLADVIEARQAEFARLLTEEQGKPLSNAALEVTFTLVMLRYYASLKLPEVTLKEDLTTRILEQRTALGVVAAIVPWNLPLLLLAVKIAPALVAGNTVVAKPAPTTPLTTLLLGELCAEIFPAGVLNIVVDHNDLGDVLTSHPDVAKVAFTGSTATGKKVVQSAAGTLKRLTLELGGNDAAIVLDDADPKVVAPKIFAGAMGNSGQVCLAIKRVYVHDSLYDQMCEELARLARETIVDDGLKQGTEMGPLQNRAQFEKVKAYLEDASENGTVIAGGTPLDRKGFFIPPTIVRDIPENARLVQEEQFGPVLPILRYTDINDAIARANNSEYGLGATVWSSDLDRAVAVARGIEAGTVWINKHLDLPPDMPFVAAKQSGTGHGLGQESLEEFTQLKIINMAL